MIPSTIILTKFYTRNYTRKSKSHCSATDIRRFLLGFDSPHLHQSRACCVATGSGLFSLCCNGLTVLHKKKMRLQKKEIFLQKRKNLHTNYTRITHGTPPNPRREGRSFLQFMQSLHKHGHLLSGNKHLILLVPVFVAFDKAVIFAPRSFLCRPVRGFLLG